MPVAPPPTPSSSLVVIEYNPFLITGRNAFPVIRLGVLDHSRNLGECRVPQDRQRTR
jgi:hypothetical protein